MTSVVDYLQVVLAVSTKPLEIKNLLIDLVVTVIVRDFPRLSLKVVYVSEDPF